MQGNSTKFTNGCIQKFLGFMKKNYHACRPAACEKTQAVSTRVFKYFPIEKDLEKELDFYTKFEPKNLFHSIELSRRFLSNGTFLVLKYFSNKLSKNKGNLQMLRLLFGVVLELVVFVFTGVDFLATEMFSGSESES